MSEGDDPDNGPATGPSAAGGNASSGTSADDRNADRRDARSRARVLQRLFEAFDVDPQLQEQIIADLSDLLPPQHRMSNAQEVGERLQALRDRDAKAHPGPLMKFTGATLDIEAEHTVRSSGKVSEILEESDERLLSNYVANERLRGVLARQLTEHDAARNVLVAELARRYTLAEQWRYKLPKFLMPVIAVLLKAGLERRDLRPGSPLLEAIIDLVLPNCRAPNVTREELKSAAQNAADQFAPIRSRAATPPPARTLVFAPENLEPWPESASKVSEIANDLPRSTGLSRSTSDTPFARWMPSVDRPPFCFMGFRRQPDLSCREGVEGPIEPADLARLELGDGRWKALSVPRVSKILGQGHPLMLPPHSNLGWYAQAIGGDDADANELEQFGSPARPETIGANGDGKKLIDAFRGVARLRLEELARMVPDHFLSNPGVGPQRRLEAAEDLARWWLFVLVARHAQDEFDRLYPGGFFHAVHGPDFIIDSNGEAFFGDDRHPSQLAIWAKDIRDQVEKKTDAELGIGEPYSGPRRKMP